MFTLLLLLFLWQLKYKWKYNCDSKSARFSLWSYNWYNSTFILFGITITSKQPIRDFYLSLFSLSSLTFLDNRANTAEQIKMFTYSYKSIQWVVNLRQPEYGPRLTPSSKSSTASGIFIVVACSHIPTRDISLNCMNRMRCFSIIVPCTVDTIWCTAA